MQVVLEWVLPNLNHVQWSKTSTRQFEWIALLSQLVVVERKCFKQVANHSTFITNRLEETLVLTKNIQNDENIKNFWIASLLTLTNDPFCSLTFSTHSLHHTASLYKERSICDDETLRFFLQNGSATTKSQVDWHLTFCLNIKELKEP